MSDVDDLLRRVKRVAGGWMPLATYRRLYETAAAFPGGDIVEIGTFRGAATIVLALGAQQSGRPFRVLTADVLRPGIGAKGASVDERIASLRRTFETFGVASSVHFVHGAAEDLVARHDPRDIGLVLLDASGMLESHLAPLWSRLRPGRVIVIDDIDGRVRVRRGWRTSVVEQKQRLTRLLVDAFVAEGLLTPLGETLSTGWYERGERAATPAAFERLALPVYRQLVKAEVRTGELGLARAFKRWLAARVPGLVGRGPG